MFINWINNFFSSFIFIASLSRKICEAMKRASSASGRWQLQVVFAQLWAHAENGPMMDQVLHRQILNNAGLKWIYPTGLSTILSQIQDSFLHWNKPLSRDWFGAMPCYALCSFLDRNDLRRWPEIWKGWDHGITNSFFNPPLRHACYRGTQDGSLNQPYQSPENSRKHLFRKMMNNPDILKRDLTIPSFHNLKEAPLDQKTFLQTGLDPELTKGRKAKQHLSGAAMLTRKWWQPIWIGSTYFEISLVWYRILNWGYMPPLYFHFQT